MAKVNYLNNKDLFAEILKSKASYCSFISDEYEQYDGIVMDLNEITPELIQETKEKKAIKMMADDRASQKASGLKNHQIKVKEITSNDIKDEDLVWRVMTYDHIPLAPGRVTTPKKEKDNYTQLLFRPFKHFIKDGSSYKEVGRSHWVGGLSNGHFSQDHGKMTNKLGNMFVMLVERYSQRPNWRGYTYVDEMKCRAHLQFSSSGLQFDESRSDTPNPFAYYTQMAQNSFTCVLNLEKKNQKFRDDSLIMNGATPSFTRQVEHEMAIRGEEFNERHGIVPSDVVVIKKGFTRPSKKPAGK